MRGQETKCSICGCQGYIYGIPSYYWDVCVDSDACRHRAVYNKEQEIKNLKNQNESLEKELKELKEQCHG